MIVKAGTVLTLECGEYSDFGYEGPFLVLRDFDQRKVCEEFVKLFSKDKLRWMETNEFTAWLAKHKYIEDPLLSFRWYTGGNGFNPSIAEDTYEVGGG